MFGKNKKSKVTEPTTESSPVVGKKKKDTMAGVLNESVVETVMNDIVKNDKFALQSNGETIYAAMLLTAADIGGINKKENKDEAKGSIVAQITGGIIKVLITPELMEKEQIVIIPEPITLDVMNEYTILVNAPYTLCFIDSSGEVTITDRKITYADMLSISNNKMGIDDFVGNMNNSKPVTEKTVEEIIEETPVSMSPARKPANVYSDPVEDFELPEVEATIDDTEPAFDDVDDIPNDTPETATTESIDEQPAVTEEVSESEYNYDNDEPDDADYDNESEAIEDDIEISDDDVMRAMTKKFYSDDLGLEVTTEPFDSQFLHANLPILFEDDRPEGWLNNYLNEKAKAANADIRKCHYDNLLEARTYYYDLISEHCQDIQRQLDISDPDTLFGKLHESLKKQKVEAESKIDELVAQRRAKLEADWDAKLEQVGEDASRAAQQQYRERFGRQHEDDLFKLEPNMQDELEHHYQDNLRQLHEDRRREAQLRLDFGVYKALSEVSEKYKKMLDEERDLYNGYASDMRDFIDTNRKDDIARTDTLAEQLRQQTEADKVREQKTAELNAATASFDAKTKELESELSKVKAETQRHLEEKERDTQRLLSESDKRIQELTDQSKMLLDRLTTLGQVKDEEYATRIKELKNEVSASNDRCEQIQESHKRSNSILIILLMAIFILALAAGFIIGEHVQVQSNTDKSNQQIKQQMDMDYSQYNAMNEVAVETTAPTTTTAQTTTTQSQSAAANQSEQTTTVTNAQTTTVASQTQ